MFYKLHLYQHDCDSFISCAPVLSDYRRFVHRSAGTDLITRYMLEHVHFGCSALLNEEGGDAFNWGTALKAGRSLVRLPMGNDIILLPALEPWKVRAAGA